MNQRHPGGIERKGPAKARRGHKVSPGTASPRSRAASASRGRRLNAGLVLACSLCAAILLVASLVYLTSAAPSPEPRSPEDIESILAEGPHAGDCESCHREHGEGLPAPQPYALIGPNDNSLCDGCHTTPWQGGSYGDTWLYVGSAHGSSPEMIWPGPEPPARMDADAASKCVNCHDPHGWDDGSGIIPSLLIAREENLCITCHDGFPAVTDVRSDFQKPFRHPGPDYSGRHRGALESLPEDFGTSPTDQRHAECEDCHNSHVARTDAAPAAPPLAAKTLLGVSRVEVLNGAAGTAPSFVFIPGSDTLTAPVTEYQLCFKCHSSFTTQPFGQPDMAVLFNPNNPSYHPVEAIGKDPNISPISFNGGWGPTSMMYCGTCHGSELGTTKGPHGSLYQYILVRNYQVSTLDHVSTPDELCFTCHTYDTYADHTSVDLIQGASRWNEPGIRQGHAWHVSTKRIPCYSCHDSHGSGSLPHLLVTGRTPGLLDFTETATTSTCTPSCHEVETYDVNYAH